MSANFDWFDEGRYGMFIHWGAYSVAARGEWVRNRERIPQHEYVEKYVANFLAEEYDPVQWAALAVEAGMKYIVLTTRHHDGFCLWDTKTTGFNATCLGPGRDLVAPFVDAVRDAGLKVGFYYSFADWHHPDYPDPYARDWPKEFRDEQSRSRFIAFCQMQLEELMTHYGKIDMLWYDGCYPKPTGGVEANAMVRSFQPDIMINERNGPPFDFCVSEQTVKASSPGQRWEASLTLNDNWGHHHGDQNYKSPTAIIRLLLRTAGAAGNLLINVGPMASGAIPEESASILREVGKWLKINGEFLPNSSISPFSWNNSGRITTKDKTVYLHFFNSPGDSFCLAEIKNKVLSVRFVATGEPINFEQNGDRLFLIGLCEPLPESITSIAIDVEGVPEAITPAGPTWIPGT
jgi:alpha-L-fucosidase